MNSVEEPGVVLADASPDVPAEGALVELVHQREALPAGTNLEQAHRVFSQIGVDFLPVIDPAGRPLGLCSRVQVGERLGSRFGFSLYSQTRVEAALAPSPLVVSTLRPLAEVVELALARRGVAFGEDVILVGAEGVLAGLIRAETLAKVQSRMVAEQLEELRAQRSQLQRQNVELFQANHEIRQSKGLYLGLMENHALGVALLDASGRVQERNRRLGDLLGAGEARGFSLIERIAERDRGEFRRMLEACEQGRAFAPTREFTLHVPGAGPRLFRCALGWIRETGQACACLDDITEQRSLEGRVALREKQSLLESLVGGIAHELNNKLTPVRGFAELLQMEESGNARAYSGLIARSVDEAARIVKQLRELTAPAGPEARRIDLRAAVEEALEMLQFRLQAARCGLVRDFPPDPLWVLADAGQIKQVVMNLGANAIDAMQGRPEPRLRVALAEAGGTVRLEVADNGMGIAPEAQRRIFDPFYTTKGPDRGTGLGLSICLSIVRQNGGEIAVRSEPGEGAVFTVTLPMLAGEEPVLVRDAGDRTEPRVPDGAKRILAVDDEEVIRHLLQEQLRRSFGCRVDCVANGREALAATRRTRYDLIVADLIMPHMGGGEFYTELLKHDPAAARRVVFITGFAGGEHEERELAGWRRPVLAKPFTQVQLARACGPVLDAVELV